MRTTTAYLSPVDEENVTDKDAADTKTETNSNGISCQVREFDNSMKNNVEDAC